MKPRACSGLIFGALLLQSGCATLKPGLSLEHPIVVPALFAVGGPPHFVSPAERYVSTYEQGWWACVEDYSKEIHYRSTPSDRIISGWGEEISGYSAGYDAAEAKIKVLIRAYGETATSELLNETLKG